MRDIDEYFDNIFVINMRKSTNRREHICKVFESLGVINYEFIRAVEPEEVDLESPLFAKNSDYNLSLSEFACALSHARIYERIYREKLKQVLICEDDIEAKPLEFDIYFSRIVEQLEGICIEDRAEDRPGGWDILHLYSHKWDQDGRIKLSENVYRGFDGHGGSVAYGVSLRGATFLYQNAYPIRRAADGLTNHLTGGWLEDKSFRGYVVIPNLFETGNFKSVIR